MMSADIPGPDAARPTDQGARFRVANMQQIDRTLKQR